MHEILSYIKTKDDIDRAISISLGKGILTANDKDGVKNEIEKLINNNDIKDWFSGKLEIKNETDVLLPDGSTIRPDRVMIKDDKLILADYKTGKKSDEHKRQLNKYADVLQQAGFKSIDKFIVYLDETEIVKV